MSQLIDQSLAEFMESIPAEYFRANSGSQMKFASGINFTNRDSYVYSDSISQEVSDKYVCSICSEFLIDPRCHYSCGNLFCHHCILTWLSSKTTCPCCRSNLAGQQLINVPNVIRDDLARLPVVCANCQQDVARGSYKTHYETVCVHKCPNGCEHSGTQSGLEAHLKVCNYQRCKYECGYQDHKNTMEAHLKSCTYKLLYTFPMSKVFSLAKEALCNDTSKPDVEPAKKKRKTK